MRIRLPLCMHKARNTDQSEWHVRLRPTILWRPLLFYLISPPAIEAVGAHTHTPYPLLLKGKALPKILWAMGPPYYFMALFGG